MPWNGEGALKYSEEREMFESLDSEILANRESATTRRQSFVVEHDRQSFCKN